MPYLYQLIQQKVTDWRSQGYPTEEYPAIAEILDFATLPGSAGLRYLRQAQLRALETYWYLRLVEGTPQTVYDVQVFNIALSDVPEGPTTVAVKIIDMLGEEVLVTAQV